MKTNLKVLEKKFERWQNSLTLILVILLMSVFILMYGLETFWIGFHNTDLCHNELVLEKILQGKLSQINMKINLSEMTVDGKQHELEDCYLSGLRLIRKGLYISLVSIFAFGILLNETHYSIRNKNR